MHQPVLLSSNKSVRLLTFCLKLFFSVQDFGLYAVLSEFTCDRKCPHKGEGIHQISARQHGRLFNASAIPQALAEEVAEYVTAKFYMDRIRYTKEAVVNDSDENNDNDGGDGDNTTATDGAKASAAAVVVVTP